MKIAITGGTGFIGRYLVRGMAGAGHDVRLLVRPGREGAVEHPPGKTAEIHVGDLTKPATVEGFLEGVDMLLHVASAHDHLSEAQLRAVNIQGTEALLPEAKPAATPSCARSPARRRRCMTTDPSSSSARRSRTSRATASKRCAWPDARIMWTGFRRSTAVARTRFTRL